MKQSIKIFIASLIVSLGMFTMAFGQNMYVANPAKNTTQGIALPAEENSKPIHMAEENFSTLFPNATQQKWSSVGANSYISFDNNGRKANASFNAKGEMNYVITSCTTNQLPAAFSKTIKNDYAAYTLLHAKEIKAHGETAYQAVIESAQQFITLKYTTDGTEEIQIVKK